MRKIIYILLIVIFTGCGDKKFDGSEQSLYSMINNLSVDEQAQFINDFELVSYVHGGENKLVGFKLEDIKNEIKRIKKLVNNKNISYLKEKIIDMDKNDIRSTSLDIKFGLISNPKYGYFYKNSYTLDDLKNILRLNGDIREFELEKTNKKAFLKGCIKQNVSNLKIKNTCECIWKDVITNYTNKEFTALSKNLTDDFKSFIRNSGNNCMKSKEKR